MSILLQVLCIPNVVSVAIIPFTLILRSPKAPSTNMAGCSWIYDFVAHLLSSLHVFQRKPSHVKFLATIFEYIYDNESINLPTILICLSNIFSENLNRNYHNLSMGSQSASLNNSKCMKIWNRTRMPSYNLDNFSELAA